MFLKLTFLEGQKRKELFLHNPPKYIYVSSSRLKCAPNGDLIIALQVRLLMLGMCGKRALQMSQELDG